MAAAPVSSTALVRVQYTPRIDHSQHALTHLGAQTSLKRIGQCTHTRLHAVRRAYRAGAQCCHPSAGCFGCRSPRVKGPLPPPLSTCPVYPVGPCLPALNQSLTLSCRRTTSVDPVGIRFRPQDLIGCPNFGYPTIDL